MSEQTVATPDLETSVNETNTINALGLDNETQAAEPVENTPPPPQTAESEETATPAEEPKPARKTPPKPKPKPATVSDTLKAGKKADAKKTAKAAAPRKSSEGPKAPVAKGAKASAAKEPKTKPAKATGATATAEPRKSSEGSKAEKPLVGKPQKKILEALAKAGQPLTRAEIAEKTGIQSGFTSLLGHTDPDKREPGSLAAKGMIKAEVHDNDGRMVFHWTLTALGRKTAAKA